MAPPRQEHNDGEVKRGIWKKIQRKETAVTDGTVPPFSLHTKMYEVVSIVESYLHAENPTDKVPERLRIIAAAMLGAALNEIGRKETTLLEYFITDLGGLEENRGEIISSVVARVSTDEFPCRWSRMNVIFSTLQKRTKQLGDNVSKILGLSNLLSEIKYSLATFLMALYATIVTENAYYFTTIHRKFEKMDDFPMKVIKTSGFESFVRFVVAVFISSEQKAMEINARKNAERSQESLRKMTDEKLSRRDSLHASVDKIYQNRVKELGVLKAKSEEPAAKMSSPGLTPEQEQLLNLYANVRTKDICQLYVHWVHDQTKIPLEPISVFFKNLKFRRETSNSNGGAEGLESAAFYISNTKAMIEALNAIRGIPLPATAPPATLKLVDNTPPDQVKPKKTTVSMRKKHPIQTKDIEKLLTGVETDNPTTERNALMTLLSWAARLRPSETANLKWEDLKRNGDLLEVNIERFKDGRPFFGKASYLPYQEGSEVDLLLRRWRERVEQKTVFVFPNVLTWQQLSGAAVYAILRKTLEDVGLQEAAEHAIRKDEPSTLLQGKTSTEDVKHQECPVFTQTGQEQPANSFTTQNVENSQKEENSGVSEHPDQPEHSHEECPHSFFSFCF